MGHTEYTVGSYKCIAFISSETWTKPSNCVKVDVLVVGGGGNTSAAKDGGGGAGGLVFKVNFKPSGSLITVTIGNAKQNSVFDTITALAGGDGGNSGHQTGYDGGSGGGGYGAATTTGGTAQQPGSASGGYGHNGGGGKNYDANYGRGGGGGGAGAVGQDYQPEKAGNGGIGLKEVTIDDITYNFATIFGTSYGQLSGGNVYFAGGGAGGNRTGGGTPTGGLGGGGNYNQDGTPNTGGGAGANNKVGGSGIVILRYIPISSGFFIFF